jgi:hypothetical protein
MFISCNGQQNEKKQNNNEKIIENKNTANPVDILKSRMFAYLKEFHPPYTEKDVIECGDILNLYLAEITKSKSKEEGMKIVKSTIEKLNILNQKCEGSLIETLEREQICEIIIGASAQKGYNTIEEDITETWREW